MADTEKLVRIATIILKTACHLKQGESLLIISEAINKKPYREPLPPMIDALTQACSELGAYPVVLDIDRYVHSGGFDRHGTLELIRQAVLGADVVLNAVDYIPFSALLGESSVAAGAWQSDKYIQGAQRFYALQSSQWDKWNITEDQIAAIDRRSDWLLDRIHESKTLHICSPAGTDFTVGYESDYMAAPFKTLVPNFGEVATIPRHGSENGVLIVDGPTQKGVRPSHELDRQPLVISVKDGHVVDYSGDDEQVARLQSFIEEADPRADHIDEVGILTTQVVENDLYWWDDGTHHHDRVHVALGNNTDRLHRVHGTAHMDLEIVKPTLTLDGLVIVKDGVFVDANLPQCPPVPGGRVKMGNDGLHIAVITRHDCKYFI